MRHSFRLALYVVVIFLPFLVLCWAAGWVMGRGFVHPDYTRLLLLIPTAGIAAAIYLILYAAKVQLRRRFLSRQVLTFEQWFETYYSSEEVSPESTRVILTLVAKGIGGRVQPVQVLPTDRLDEDFTFSLCGTAIDKGILLNDPLEYLGEELSAWFKEQTGHELEPDPTWNTIDDVIRNVSDRLGRP